MPRKEQYHKRAKEYNAYQKQWARAHRDKIRLQARARHRKVREHVIRLYGNKCVCCGITQYEFLAIDHINGGGCKERREKNFPNSQSFYSYLSKNYEPEKYQVLCHNCNSAKAFYGQCPHKENLNGR